MENLANNIVVNKAIQPRIYAQTRVTYQDTIAPNQEDRIVFASDKSTRPDASLSWRKPDYTKRSERILPVAREKDIVLTNQPVNKQHLEWLRSIGLGTDNVYSFDAPVGITLPQLIIRHKDEVSRYLTNLSGNLIVAPEYSGDLDYIAATELGLPFFGNPGEVSVQFYDKGLFKDLAWKLGIPVTEGETIDPYSTNLDSIKITLQRYMRQTGRAIVKSTSASGSALLDFVATAQDVEEVAAKVKRQGQKSIVEILYPVDFEVNDSWIIDREGDIAHLGNSYQIYDSQGKKVLKTNVLPLGRDSPLSQIHSQSVKVAKTMRNAGYIGPFGLDYIISDGTALLVENNARVNQLVIEQGILGNLGDRVAKDYWEVRKVRLEPMEFAELASRTKEILPNGSQGRGCFFPYDITDLPEDGSFQAIFTGATEEEAREIFEMFKRQTKR